MRAQPLRVGERDYGRREAAQALLRDALHGRDADKIRRAEINVEEVQNVILEGGVAASCRIQLDGEPGSALLAAIKVGNSDIIGLELLRLTN